MNGPFKMLTYERKLCGLYIAKMTHTKIDKENLSNKNNSNTQT